MTTRLARIGTFYWTVPYSTEIEGAQQKLVEGVVDRLRHDPRVLSAVVPRSPVSASTRSYLPPVPESDDATLKGVDAKKAIQLDSPIVFDLKVPIKNQRDHGGFADIPTDSYTVVWDGITMIVGWDQGGDDIPLSGGHVAVDVLRDAVEGDRRASLVNQACNSECSFEFVHTTLVLQPGDAQELRCSYVSTEGVPAEGARSAIYFVEGVEEGRSLDQVLYLVFLDLSICSEIFARMRNVSARMRAIDEAARITLNSSLLNALDEAVVVENGYFKSLVQRRGKVVRNRRHIRRLSIELLICVANLDSLRQKWLESRREFDDACRLGEYQVIYAVDTAADSAAAHGMDLSHLEHSVGRLFASLDNSSLSTATIAAACSGGVVGGLIGIFSAAFF